MTSQRLFGLAAEFAQATGNAERFHARAASATGDDRAAHTEKAEMWDALARGTTATPCGTRFVARVRAVPDDELPVATWRRGRVEIRATTTDGVRAVRVRYAPARALAPGRGRITPGHPLGVWAQPPAGTS